MKIKKPKIFSRLIKVVLGKIFYHVKYYNSDNLDLYESYIICPNHSSIFDIFYVFPLKYDFNLYAMAKRELFEHWYFRKIAKHYNIIPIDRSRTNAKSMMQSLHIFRENKNAKMIIFPEGKVIKDEKDVGKVYKKVATFIAMNMTVPIIPVYISRRPKLFQRVEVKYGKPYFVEKDNLEESAKELIYKIYELNNQGG